VNPHYPNEHGKVVEMLAQTQTRQGKDWRGWTPDAKQQLLRRLRDIPTPNDVTWGKYQANPVGFAMDVLGDANLTDGQIAVLNSVRDNKVTVVQSANAVGKTFVAADAALWFLRTFGRSKVITAAAPPEENLKRLLWGEINTKLLAKPDLFGEARAGVLTVELSAEWWLVGVAIPMSGTPAEREAKFSGKHAPHLLFIVDEADAVPDEVYKGIEACMSGGHVRLLCMFNPRAASGPVYRMIKAGAHLIELDAFSHPNVVDGSELIPGAVSRAITVERIHNWSRPATEGEKPSASDPEWFTVPAFLDGEMALSRDGTLSPPLLAGQCRQITNPALSYMTLARFPGQAETQLISRGWVEAAQQRWLARRALHGDRPPEGVRPLHGQDVAEFGADNNVACFRYGGWVAPLEMWSGVDILVTGDRAAKAAYERNAQASYVDATGVGSGVAPQMTRWWARNAPGYAGRAEAIKVAESPTAKAMLGEGEFAILRDQLWWVCREWLRADPSAMLPPDADLADELCTPLYHTRRGKIAVSDKDTMRHLLHRSPDKADSLCLTFGGAVHRHGMFVG